MKDTSVEDHVKESIIPSTTCDEYAPESEPVRTVPKTERTYSETDIVRTVPEPVTTRDIQEPSSNRDTQDPSTTRDVLEPTTTRLGTGTDAVRTVPEPATTRVVSEPTTTRVVSEPATTRAVLESVNNRPNNNGNGSGWATDNLKKGRKRLKSEESMTEGGEGNNGGNRLPEVAKKRPRRGWELWSNDDKHIFFSALNEYGKEFDKIQEYFKSKMKNKQNVPAEFIKNKNQIRHFYYRTWHKISVYINFNTELKTSTKELFGLINYGELWKKIGGNLTDKVGLKLDELVQKGSVTIKHKGKTLRVKTPVCPVLKQIHNKPDNKGKQKDELLPTRVTIELRPRHTSDWIRVHKMAQNPVIKVTMGLQRKLASLLKCLKSKWKSREQKLLENLQSRGEGVGSSGTHQDMDLILVPARGSEKRLPVIIPLPTITSSQISLQSMKDDTITLTQEPDSGNPKHKMKLRLDPEDGTSAVVSEANGNCSDPGFCADAENCDKNSEACNTLDMNNQDDGIAEDIDDYLPEDSDGENSQSPVPPLDPPLLNDKDLDIDDDKDIFPDDLKDDIAATDSDKVKKEGGICKDKDLKSNQSNLAGLDPRQGWSLSNCGKITIGEIFLMLGEGKDPCFGLEYEWRQEIKKESSSSNEISTIAIGSPEIDIKPSCAGVLGKLVKLSTSQLTKGSGRGRNNSTSTCSPSIRAPAGSPTSPAVTSRSSPVSRGIMMAAGRGGGVAKQLLSDTAADKPEGPLAVPLEQEAEFRKPLAPAPAVKPTPVNSTFSQQIGQYFPKFSNRRGRQNRSRMNNKFVGRQVLKPIQSSLLQPVQTINVATANLNTNPNFIITPSPIILSSCTGLPGLPVQGNTATLVLAPVPTSAVTVTHSVTNQHMLTTSPPQISIPSPVISTNQQRGGITLTSNLLSVIPQSLNSLQVAPSSIHTLPPRTPSPTPSLSSLMDLSFSDATSSSMGTKHKDSAPEPFLNMMEDSSSSLLNTPVRVTTPPSAHVNLSEDISLTSWGLTFESPIKQSGILSHNDDSQTSIISTNSEVDRQLTAMMNENSIDFTSTFRQLAKHVTSSDKDQYNQS